MRMRALRRERNLRQADVARALGMSQSAYSKFEIDDGANMPREKICALADYYGVTVDYLMADDAIEDAENRLLAARNASGLTMRQVGIELGVSAQTIWNWEHGRIKPSASALQRLSALYGVTVDYLTGQNAPGEETKLPPLHLEPINQPGWGPESEKIRQRMFRLLSSMSDDQLREAVRYMEYLEERDRSEDILR